MFLFLSQRSSQITYHRELSSLPWLLRAVIVSRTSFLDNTHRFEEYCSGVLCSVSTGSFLVFFLATRLGVCVSGGRPHRHSPSSSHLTMCTHLPDCVASAGQRLSVRALCSSPRVLPPCSALRKGVTVQTPHSVVVLLSHGVGCLPTFPGILLHRRFVCLSSMFKLYSIILVGQEGLWTLTVYSGL